MSKSQGSTAHPVLIAFGVMLATIMQVLDTTIANIALPHMSGNLAASLDQIAWVLTSYIVASAIMTLPVGYLAQRLGRRRLMLWSIAGFTVASMLCGQADSLSEIIAWRIVQGLFGAAVVPLSQAILLDSFPKEKHALAMSIWGMGVMVGPILGPTLGGLLTEYYSWRWVFYINLPVGILSLLMVFMTLPETEQKQERFDLRGFALLALAVAALQLMLDRGGQLDWFNSLEIQLYAVLIVAGVYLFAVHCYTSDTLLFSPVIFSDRNFLLGILFIFTVVVSMFGTLALLPSFLQQWKGYPVVMAGILMMPRGIGSVLTMSLVSPLSRLVGPRLMIVVGMSLNALALYQMAGFTLEVEQTDIILAGFIQGVGMGLITVPISMVAFSTLPPALRNDGAALFSLSRSVGSSIGVSVVVSILARNMWTNQQELGERLQIPADLWQSLSPDLGIAVLPGAILAEINRSAAEIAYVNNFHVMALVTLAVLPFVFLLKVQRGDLTQP